MSSFAAAPLRVAELDGVRARYLDVGHGAPVVLVHGFLTDHRAWQEVIARMSPHARLLALDLPGFGASEKPSWFPYGPDGWSRVVGALLEHAGLHRAHLVGHALGASTALCLAAARSAVVDRLAVVSAVWEPVALPWSGSVALLDGVGPLVFRHLFGRGTFDNYFQRAVYGPWHAADQLLLDRWWTSFDVPEGRDAALRALQVAARGTDVAPLLPRVEAPTLVLAGDHDRVVSVSASARLAQRLPDARLQIIPRAGHAPHEEQPEDTARALLDFLLVA